MGGGGHLILGIGSQHRSKSRNWPWDVTKSGHATAWHHGGDIVCFSSIHETHPYRQGSGRAVALVIHRIIIQRWASIKCVLKDNYRWDAEGYPFNELYRSWPRASKSLHAAASTTAANLSLNLEGNQGQHLQPTQDASFNAEPTCNGSGLTNEIISFWFCLCSNKSISNFTAMSADQYLRIYSSCYFKHRAYLFTVVCKDLWMPEANNFEIPWLDALHLPTRSCFLILIFV